MTPPQTAVVLLNWNGWQDTLACVKSLLLSHEQDFVIVLCDNGSTDASWAQMTAWSATDAQVRSQVLQPGAAWDRVSQVVLIQTGANLGFAGGCNVGLRFALQATQCEYFWLLNNDTVVDAGALGAQVRAMRADARVGLLGSTLVYYDNPDLVQCFGGYGFNFWNARVRPFRFQASAAHPPSVGEVEQSLRYVSGASTFVSRSFVESVGLLNEQYFLYFEEIDWAIRGKAFRMSYCPQSVVLHKEGRSIGSNRSALQRSSTSELWLTRNRILFMRTYFRRRLPITLLWVLCVGLARLCSGRGAMARVLFQGIWAGLIAPVQPLPQFAQMQEQAS